MSKVFYQLSRSPAFHAINILIWLVFAVANSTRNFSLQSETSYSFWFFFKMNLMWFLPWALITIALLAYASANPFVKERNLWILTKVFVVWHLIACVYYPLGTLLDIMVNPSITLADFGSRLSSLLHGPVYFDYAFFAGVTFVCYSLIYYREYNDEHIKNEQLARQLAQAELQALRSQLNPHFLFNTLNTVAGLIRVEKPKQALTAISQLSQLLRAALEQNDREMILLEQEMQFVRSYLHIQELRFHDKLTVKIDVEDHCQAFLVPCMLLQPLLENAVQYGVNSNSENNEISLVITADAQHLHITLENALVENKESSGFGIGLNNTIERLARLFEQKHQISLTESDNKVRTQLQLPLLVA